MPHAVSAEDKTSRPCYLRPPHPASDLSTVSPGRPTSLPSSLCHFGGNTTKVEKEPIAISGFRDGRIQIERGSASSPDTNPVDTESVIWQYADYFAHVESKVLDATIDELNEIKTTRDRTAHDKAFAYFSRCLLLPYTQNGLASRHRAILQPTC